MGTPSRRWPAMIATQKWFGSARILCVEPSMGDVFIYSHRETTRLFQPNSKTTTDHKQAPTLENSAAPCSLTTQYCYPLMVARRYWPSPRVPGREVSVVIGVPPLCILATSRIVPAPRDVMGIQRDAIHHISENQLPISR